MWKWTRGLLVILLVAAPVRAHFVWIVPEGRENHRAKLIFSENLVPDEAVPIERISGAKLFARDADGSVTPVELKKGEQAFLLSLPKRPAAIGGNCTYGVKQRKGKTFLLVYHPKLICGDFDEPKPWDKLLLEIRPKANRRFQVTFSGKPVTDAQVVMITAATDGPPTTLQVDGSGEFALPPDTSGLCGIRARYIEAKAGEHSGKKYEEIRHYATLVVQLEEAKDSSRTGTANLSTDEKQWPVSLPPLPRGVSSFGAAVADGWLYVYGGHCARTHQYSRKSALGTFHRLRLSDPKAWDELPSGPALQGLGLVAHNGMIYRIGGMESRNEEGESADNYSVAVCSRFNPNSQKWESLPDLPAARSSHDAVVVGDKLVVVGGWKMIGGDTPPEWHADALVLDLKQSVLKWTSVVQPFRRRALTAAVYDGKVHVIGGMSEESVPELTVNVYDIQKNSWTNATPLPGPRRNGFAAAAVTAGNNLYVSPAEGSVLRLARDGGSWEEVGRLKQPRIVHRIVAAQDDLLVVVGGAHSGDNIAATEIVRIRTRALSGP
jgi:N-acetylneuraminic acid mutarotase